MRGRYRLSRRKLGTEWPVAGDIADQVVELQIHLIQSVSHVLHLTRRRLLVTQRN
jgi:hypothetical protein